MSSDEGFAYYDNDDEAPAGLVSDEEDYGNAKFPASHPAAALRSGAAAVPSPLTKANLGKNTWGAPAAAAAKKSTAAPSPAAPAAAAAPTGKGDGDAAIELEVAKRLLQAQVTVTVQRYDAHITLLLDDYFSAIKERRILFNASRAIAAPLIPFGGGGAEERSATVRFERMLMAGSRAMEVELNAFRNHCFTLQAEWQKEFLVVCANAREAEERRKDDLLNLQTVCRKEVGATCNAMKAAFAARAVEIEGIAGAKEELEALREEAAGARQALQEARRIGAEDRQRHFADREALVAEFSETLRREREGFAEKIKSLDVAMGAERSAHLAELHAAAERHARASADLHAQLAEAREQGTHSASDASCVRGESAAERRAFAEERVVTQRYVRELEAALVELGGRPELIASARAAEPYLASAAARRDRLTGGYPSSSSSSSLAAIGLRGQSYGGGGGSGGVLIANSSVTAAAAAGQTSLVSAALAAASPRTAAGAAVRQHTAMSVVDEMLNSRGVGGGGGGYGPDRSLFGHSSSALSPSSAAGLGIDSRSSRLGHATASPFSKEHAATIEDVAGRRSFLHHLRSPSAERGRSASPNNHGGFGAYGGGAGSGSGLFRESSYGAPTMGEAERARTVRNLGGTVPSASSSARVGGGGAGGGAGYFSSRR